MTTTDHAAEAWGRPPMDAERIACQVGEVNTIRVTVTVDPAELHEWAEKHADAGHHGVAHVLYKAAEGVESITEQHDREVAERAERLTAERDALAAALAEQTARADHEDRCAVTAQRTADRLTAQVERVRGLHRPAIHVEPGSPCLACGWPYPCPTVRALDGEVE